MGHIAAGRLLLPELIELPGGSFLMGNDHGRPDEQPRHRVQLDAFRAAVSPVTNAQYACYVAAEGAPDPPFSGDDRFSLPEQPAVGISWHDAVAFCGWLTARTGTQWRLPTEAEREFAALGGLEASDWPWIGAGPGGHPAFAEISVLERPHAPGPACANGYGLRCMAENVHEWCSDWYDPRYYAASPVHSPAGPGSGRRKVSRGGAWRHREKFTRINARSSLDPSFHYSDFGFRVYV